MTAPWSLVVPVKPFHLGKSRLAGPYAPWRRELAHAFCLDTLRAVSATPGARAVVVVTADPLAAVQARTMGAVVVADTAPRGLNAAVRRAAAVCGRLNPGGPVAVVPADLPALRPAELGEVLRLAAPYERAFVPDHAGEGTTVLTASAPGGLAPGYGPGSALRHAASGAHRVDVPATSGVRRDVDVRADLAGLAAAGVLGVYTTAALSLCGALGQAQEFPATAAS
jgi:2-phospho-L-lactate guanylyltransferase